MRSMGIYLAFYLVAMILQLLAAGIAFSAYRFVEKYRFGWLFLASGLFIMAARRITPWLHGNVIPEDAILSLIISLLLLLGIITVKTITADLQAKDAKLEKLLQYDHLTNVFSRAEIFNRGHLEIQRAQRFHQPLGVLMLDIDHFKRINDDYGHPAGDSVLSHLAHDCSSCLREIDLMGRVGGEEFLVLLPNTNLEGAAAAANRIRHHIAHCSHPVTDHHSETLTISIGATSFMPEDWSPETDHSNIFKHLVKMADQAMYQAKMAGRNRTSFVEAVDR